MIQVYISWLNVKFAFASISLFEGINLLSAILFLALVMCVRESMLLVCRICRVNFEF